MELSTFVRTDRVEDSEQELITVLVLMEFVLK